jgi:hypothetical protein
MIIAATLIIAAIEYFLITPHYFHASRLRFLRFRHFIYCIEFTEMLRQYARYISRTDISPIVYCTVDTTRLARYQPIIVAIALLPPNLSAVIYEASSEI